MTGVELLQAYLAMMNTGDSDLIGTFATRNYRDHDPIMQIPMLRPDSGATGNLRDLHKQAAFLAIPTVNVEFALCDVLEDDDKIAYRLEGVGSMLVLAVESGFPGVTPLMSAEPNCPIPIDAPTRLVAPRSAMIADIPASQRDQIDRLEGIEYTIDYRCVGIFRVVAGRLSERWGRQTLLRNLQ
jgi:hypothetical protein